MASQMKTPKDRRRVNLIAKSVRFANANHDLTSGGHSTSTSKLSFDFKNQLLILDLQNFNHFFILQFNEINMEFNKQDNTIVIDKVNSSAGQLYFIKKPMTTIKDIKGSSKDYIEIKNDQPFMFHNKKYKPSEFEPIRSNKMIEVEVPASKADFITKMLAELQIHQKRTLPEEIDPSTKRRKIELTIAKSFYLKESNCFTSSGRTCFDDREVELPCCGRKIKVCSKLVTGQFVCENRLCEVHLRFSYCLGKVIYSRNYQHCEHQNKCVSWVETENICKSCLD